MHLSQQQQEVLLLNRRSHLQRMRCIYLERQGLNMQVLRLTALLATPVLVCACVRNARTLDDTQPNPQP
jgi:hypothetical protein